MRQTQASGTDPAVAALGELTDSIGVGFKALEEDDKALRDRVAKLEQQSQAGFSAHASRLERVERGTIRAGGGSVDLSWIPEAQRAAIYGVAEHGIRSGADQSRRLLADPDFRAATVAFLLASTMAQNPKLSGVHQAEWAELLTKGYKSFGVPVEKAAAFITTTDTLGGHWLPDPVSAEIWRLITDASVFARLGRTVQMVTKTLDLPVEGSSALTVFFTAEGADITDSVPASNALNKVTLTAAKLAGYGESSLEAIQDSAAAILDFVLGVLTEKSGRKIDEEALEGTQFSGMSILANTSVNAIGSGANGDAVDYPALAEIVYKARERASRDGARWFVAPEMMQKVVGLVDTVGQPIFKFSSVPGAIEGTLLGFPVEVHSVIKADRTYGTGTTLSHIYFGPPRSMIIGNRAGMSWDTSREGALFKSYGVAFRLVSRVALGLAVPKAWTRRHNLDV